MKSKSRCMIALLIALLVFMGMANTVLAKETYSKPFDLSGRIKHPSDDKRQADADPSTGEPVDPEEVKDHEPEKETEVSEEPTDPGEGVPDESDTPEPPLDPAAGQTEPAEPEEGALDEGDPIEPEPETADPEATEPPEEAADPAEEDQSNDAPIPGTVRTEDENGKLNLRATPGTDGVIILTIPSGAALTVIRYEGQWAYVEYEGKLGYVFARYVSEAEPTEEEIIPEDSPEVEDPIERKAQIHADKNPDALYVGDEMNMWVELTGFEGLNTAIQWQTCSRDGDWADIDGATDPTYSVTITEDVAGHSWRAKVSVQS